MSNAAGGGRGGHALTGSWSVLRSSNLTFSLSPGWLFVETEDWRPDLEGTWAASIGADDGTYFLSSLSVICTKLWATSWLDLHQRYMVRTSFYSPGRMESDCYDDETAEMDEKNLFRS